MCRQTPRLLRAAHFIDSTLVSRTSQRANLIRGTSTHWDHKVVLAAGDRGPASKCVGLRPVSNERHTDGSTPLVPWSVGAPTEEPALERVSLCPVSSERHASSPILTGQYS